MMRGPSDRFRKANAHVHLMTPWANSGSNAACIIRKGPIMKVHERSVILLMIWVLVLGSATTPREEVDCISCNTMFSKIHETPSFKKVQQVEMQLRGEPKSGTGMMHQWAWAILYQTCAFLKRLFGEDTCRIDRDAELSWKSSITRRSLIFKPSRGGRDSQCTCQGVDSVLISLSKRKKHELPVDPKCIWWHHNGIARYEDDTGITCPAIGGNPVSNYSDVLECMTEANCAIADNRPQLIVMRDPRPVAVSSYYHKKAHITFNETLEDFIPKILPRICMWVTIRHELFTGILSNQSTVYWYHEAIDDPLAWHYKYLDSVGLWLPSSLVESVKDAALREEFPFKFKTRDLHSEKSPSEVSPNRSWKKEVGTDMVETMTGIVRMWLPPIILAKLGVQVV